MPTTGLEPNAIEPEPVESPTPVVTDTSPPVPLDDELEPAIIVTEPPLPTSEEPTTTETLPALPPIDEPVETTTDPDEPA